MNKLKVTEELMREVREEVFGPCTVVYEANTIPELLKDLEEYLKDNRVFFKGDRKAIYTPSLTITTFKSWLLLRKEVEIWDVDPETPFDRTDAQIEKAIKVRKELEERLNTNINRLIERLRKEAL